LSEKQGKFIIGLTGNIGTGKTVVRRMLEHMGAYTIDADRLAHRAIARGAPGYDPVVLTFGRWIVNGTGEIDRAKLANLVFRDSVALRQLEAIIHPFVRQAVDILIKRATQPVVVIEAIKLLEGDLRRYCDNIWVTYAPPALQIERLVSRRHMSREEAMERVSAQSPQTDKISAANVVIRNVGTYDDLWTQVADAWREHVPASAAPEQPRTAGGESGAFSVARGRPKDAARIAEFINRLSAGTRSLSAADVMAEFGEKAYMLLQMNRDLVAVAGWQVENLVVRTTDIYIEPGIDQEKALETLVGEIELVSGDLQCEIALIFPDDALAGSDGIWDKMGYERRLPDSLDVQAWADAARESMPGGTPMFFKQLRKDRVLRPI
jgi:dephospho-CoA kinase